MELLKDIASAMKVTLNNVGKRFNYHWIFNDINIAWQSPAHIAIKGTNGSGKSTLMSILAGLSAPNQGFIEWHFQEKKIEQENIFKFISWCSPAVELPEEFTLLEIIRFQHTFKNWVNDLSENEILRLLNLEKEAHQFLKNFSTGMKQRVKLALALLADVPMVLLDEPTSNLDEFGIAWYKNLLEKFSNNRLIIIASNQTEDFVKTATELNLQDFKK